MLRECTLEDISDGRVYGLNDMVKADTGSCQGCHKCCTGMGSSIVLDPYDVWQLKLGLGKSFQELLNDGRIELNMVDGLILPNIRMGEGDRCTFLDAEGRCSIHKNRPGICRIFPLGRVYSDDGFQYFIQKDECVKANRAKVKVRKWIDTDNVEENQKFIADWHSFIRSVGNGMIKLRDSGRGEQINDIVMYVLNTFFVSDIVDKDDSDAAVDSGMVYKLIEDNVAVAKDIIGGTYGII